MNVIKGGMVVRHVLCEPVSDISVDPELKVFKFVVAREAASREIFRQSNCSGEEAVRVELIIEGT